MLIKCAKFWDSDVLLRAYFGEKKYEDDLLMPPKMRQTFKRSLSQMK